MILIMRHLKTYTDTKKQEKIIYDDAFEKTKSYVDFIIKVAEKNPNIKNIVIVCSPQERTLMTGLILSSSLKSKIISSPNMLNISKSINIVDPVIESNIDRDPKKERNKKYYLETMNKYYTNNSICILITHSSIIYNLYKCILENIKKVKLESFEKKIKSYSLSYIYKDNHKIYNKFNIDMKKKKF